MAKTLVKVAHPGQHANSFGGCYSRFGGWCPGRETAQWLNSLGDDKDKFTSHATVGQVRENWVRYSGHITWADRVIEQTCPRCNGTGRVIAE